MPGIDNQYVILCKGVVYLWFRQRIRRIHLDIERIFGASNTRGLKEGYFVLNQHLLERWLIPWLGSSEAHCLKT